MTELSIKTGRPAVATGFTLVELLVVIVIIMILIALLLPAVQSRVGPAPRHDCANNLKQIGLALHNYHDVYKCFPPAFVADENGVPMHSWRVLILPYMEQETLYEQYDFNEPWDGPNNSKLHDTFVATYSCPANEDRNTPMTNYVAIVGPETVFPGDQPLGIDDVTDGTGATLFVVETTHSGIHWMEPRDLTTQTMSLAVNPDQDTLPGISSNHPGVATALRIDGSVCFLSDDLPAKTLRAMLTVAGGETIAW